WYDNAKSYLAKCSETSTSHEGLLFIHGYNVSIDAALWRSAQLCHDLKFPGLMLCFSWASLGSTTGYPADEATVDWSAAHLKEYLTNVTENLGLTSLHIVAHSMGNRALLAV
ncbi:alpha/beta fold hydrolase, partial [Pseudomonas viridiflava]|uniref:alpha/beta fold hydrolase n=1 Tax=Pseudomonas viridiflava TaxID=33069 RepID=UPI000F07ADE9